MKDLSKLLISATVVACSFVTSAQATPVLVGSATLKTTDDLTVITDGQTTYQFLDLTSTTAMTTSQALAKFGADNFSQATSADLSRLFEAFGFTFASQDHGISYLPITQQEGNSFVSYLGNTGGIAVASLGTFNDLNYGMSYACISWDRCANNAFTNNKSVENFAFFNIGTFLVRSAPTEVTNAPDPSNVPEPTSVALLGLGITGLAAARRRRQK